MFDVIITLGTVLQPTLRRYSLHECFNDNGERLVNLALSKLGE